jgi:TetR/AcrR family transcriptional repressor of mexJK operon
MDRRSQYLDVALRLFAEHGYIGTSMDMLIAEVGGSKATLYKHFPAKGDLVAGLIDRIADTISQDMTDPKASTTPLADELTAIARSACSGVWSPDAIALVRLCLGEFGRFPQLARTIWEHAPAVTYANFTAFIAERQRRGEIIVDDPQIAAEQFLGGTVGHQQLKLAFGMTTPPTDSETEARIESAVKTFLARYGTNNETLA